MHNSSFIACVAVGLVGFSSSLGTLHAQADKPTRDAFLNEVLDARPTKVTSKFDDYTRGSYHINNLDLLKGLVAERRNRKLDLHAVIIVGPEDFLWSYHVTAFLREGDQLRANTLVFPHARITYKGTGRVPVKQLEKLTDDLSQSGVAKQGFPKGGSFQLLFATWSNDGKEMRILFGELTESKERDKFGELYNNILKDMKQTYPEKNE